MILPGRRIGAWSTTASGWRVAARARRSWMSPAAIPRASISPTSATPRTAVRSWIVPPAASTPSRDPDPALEYVTSRTRPSIGRSGLAEVRPARGPKEPDQESHADGKADRHGQRVPPVSRHRGHLEQDRRKAGKDRHRQERDPD